MSHLEIVVPERRNRAMALLSLVAAFLLVAFLGVVSAESPAGERLSPAALLMTSFGWGAVAFLGVQARFFLKARGGVTIDRVERTLRLHTMGGAEHDVVVPLAQVVRVAVSPRWETLRRGERVMWALEVERAADVPVVVGEHENGEAASRLGQVLAERLGCPFESGEFFRGRVPRPRLGWRSTEVTLGPRWHLFGPVTSMGVLVVVLGAFLFTTVDRSFFFGIVVAPFLLLLGGLFLVTSVLLTWGRQQVVVEAGDDGDRVVHRVHLGSRAVFDASIAEADKLRVRVYPNGARGACLEVLSPTRVLALGNGVNGATRTRIGELDALARDVHAALFDGAGFEADPPVPSDVEGPPREPAEGDDAGGPA